MKFLSLQTTDDGRLTKSAFYFGSIVMVYNRHIEKDEMRIVVYDNKGEWMTFNPQVFVPAEGMGL